ncbi:L-type lectin-domain containing receptor kinase IX.2-like [Lolium rigidum]|uniref:L-type lectin-domain containing receptor kinase IX.2-like n=1 Tax=Lolium rigidum TaxID=89674 RepID=UPI001F5D66F4|nr:L-type lectin-domain containing receptor kinase IX.2-like [Lolium rigidum]
MRWDTRSNTLDGGGSDLYLIDKESKPLWSVGVNYLRNLSSEEQKNIRLFSAMDGTRLWNVRKDVLEAVQASFSVIIDYKPLKGSGMAFLILPADAREFLEEQGAKDLAMQDRGKINLQGTTHNATVSGGTVSVTIGALVSNSFQLGIGEPARGVDISIDAAAAFNYTVWIDYDLVERRLSVYVDVEANPKPNNTVAELDKISRFTYDLVNFGLFSTVAQHLSVSRWNITVKDVRYCRRDFVVYALIVDIVSFIGCLVIAAPHILRVVSDRILLAESMERLPGVPKKVKFADIKKATDNFDMSKKLGQGAFGAVYRCTLPSGACKTGQPTEVAVKRFNRNLANRNSLCGDFLAEVSIINRLSHKNIVPLLGWSYNQEPILLFEFMANGSLDQHLFPRGGNGTSNDAAIRQWATRYGIVRDIAAGLHYVHHEYEPMVLHRDIKASNVMLDSSFSARIGDFGLACTVSVEQNEVADSANGYTRGYVAPEYVGKWKATRRTDVYAFGVLTLEVVTGKPAVILPSDEAEDVDEDNIHIVDRVWRIHGEERLRQCVDATLTLASSTEVEEAERLLLLGLACCHPNQSERPTMPEVVRVIAKSAPPPMVPLVKPVSVLPEEDVASRNNGGTPISDDSIYMTATSTWGYQSLTSLWRSMVGSKRAVRRSSSLQLGQP